MQIIASYDSSVNSAPSGYKAAIQSSIAIFDAIISNNITITIDFGWNEAKGAPLSAGNVGESYSSGQYYSYSQVYNALSASALSANDKISVAALPKADPTHGGRFYVPDTEAVALGLSAPRSITGYVGLSSAYTYTFDVNNRAVAGQNDAIGAINHEISEVLGRIGYLGIYYNSSSNNTYSLMDLFRYSPGGILDSAANAYFSIDAGKTLLTQFNDPTNGGDVADWIPTLKGDSFGDNYRGVASYLSYSDYIALDVLGYGLGSTTGFNLNGTGPSQIFVSTPGDDAMTGLSGVNTATYVGNASTYSISISGATITIADPVAGRDGTDTLVNIQQAKFADYTLVFDLHSSQDLLVYEIYQAAYGRTPDNAGFRYWAGIADANHTTALSLADSFLAAPEFAQLYGTNPTNTAYVTELYSHVLGRAPDPAGLAYWVGQANAGQARDSLMVAFATSTENVQLIGSHVANGYWTT